MRIDLYMRTYGTCTICITRRWLLKWWDNDILCVFFCMSLCLCVCEQFDLIESEYGCCRAEPFMCRKPYEMFSFLLSRYRMKPEYDPNAPLTDASLTNHAQR